MNTLNPLAIEEFLKKELAKLLSIPIESIDNEMPFDKFGLESAKSILMVGKLEDFLDIELPSRLLWDYNNIKSLSVYLSELMQNQ